MGPNILTKPMEEVYSGVSQPTTAAAIIEASAQRRIASQPFCDLSRPFCYLRHGENRFTLVSVVSAKNIASDCSMFHP